MRERNRERKREGEEAAQAGQYIHFEHPPPPSLSDMPDHQNLYNLKNNAKKSLPAWGFEPTTLPTILVVPYPTELLEQIGFDSTFLID